MRMPKRFTIYFLFWSRAHQKMKLSHDWSGLLLLFKCKTKSELLLFLLDSNQKMLVSIEQLAHDCCNSWRRGRQLIGHRGHVIAKIQLSTSTKLRYNQHKQSAKIQPNTYT